MGPHFVPTHNDEVYERGNDRFVFTDPNRECEGDGAVISLLSICSIETVVVGPMLSLIVGGNPMTNREFFVNHVPAFGALIIAIVIQ